MSNLNRIIRAGLILLAASVEAHLADAQVSAKMPWEPHPQEFVRNMAIQASIERETVQRSLHTEKLNHDHLQQKLKTATGSAAKALRAEIKNSSNKLEQLQTKLTAFVKAGKEFKDLTGQPDKLVVRKLGKMDLSPFITLTNIPGPNKPDSIKSVALIPPPAEIQITAMQAESQVRDVAKEPKFTPKGTPSLNTRELPEPVIPAVQISVQEDCLFQSAPPGNKDKPGLALRPEVLLKYTPEVLRKYMGGQAYITGQAFIGTEPGLTYLQLYLEFATEQALRQYGNLGKSILLIRLINGKEVRLVVNRFDQGSADPELKKSTMSGVYYLEKSVERSLADTPVDRVRLVFATGYEEFVIYNVDFFTRQLGCINAQK